MELLRTLETKLDDILNKHAPFSLPPDGRRSLAQALWWVVIVVGIIELYAAISLWQWGHVVDRVVDIASHSVGVYAPRLSFFYYVAVLAMGAVGVALLVASANLKAMKKSGWDLAFYAVLLAGLAALCQLFASGAGFFDFFVSLLGTVVGAYLLFQVRDLFIMSKLPADGHKAPSPKKAAAPTPAAPFRNNSTKKQEETAEPTADGDA